MNKTNRITMTFIILALAIFLVFVFTSGKQQTAPSETISIGIVANRYIQDIDTNYYKQWLESQTGLNIEFYEFPQEYTSEYLDRMFQSGDITVDALFSFPGTEDSASASAKLQKYGQLGYILPLNDYIKDSAFMQMLFSDFSEYDLESVMTSSDGNIYYMPGLDTSKGAEYTQVLWINKGWLENLNLQIPKTTEEFESVLLAFQNDDPNGNGLHDEIALAGSMDCYSEQSFNFILNAYVYNDPNNSRMAVENGKVYFAPVTQQWREGVQFLNQLYADGLLDEFQFTLNHDQLVQLANDPRDLLGAFTSSSITDVILQNSPERLSDFIRVEPLEGPDGLQLAAVSTPLPSANGIITSACQNPEAVFHLFELMLSKEAFLIGRYGEEGVDWQYAQTGQLDVFGNQATISIKNQLWNTVQNKHLLELGPFLTYNEYANGITWNGLAVDQEYMDARAYELYSQYRPAENIKTIVFEGEDSDRLSQIRSQVNAYTDAQLKEFITGGLNPYDDSQWAQYISEYDALNINDLIPAVQESYDSLQKT